MRSRKRKCPPDEQPFEGGENVVVVTPRSSLLRKSVRVDRGDGDPPSDVKRWENCAAQESSKCH